MYDDLYIEICKSFELKLQKVFEKWINSCYTNFAKKSLEFTNGIRNLPSLETLLNNESNNKAESEPIAIKKTKPCVHLCINTQ